MTSTKRNLLLGGGLLAVFAVAAFIYFVRFRHPALNEALHIGVGNAMAIETARVLGSKGKILAIVIDSSKTPELKVQLDEFERTLQKLGGFTISKKLLETEGKH